MKGSSHILSPFNGVGSEHSMDKCNGRIRRKTMNKLIFLAKYSVFISGLLLCFQGYFRANNDEQDQNITRTKVLEDVLYFSRVPKTGSENFAFLFSELSKANNFTHFRYGQPDPRHLSLEQQEKHVEFVLSKKQRPLSYDRHVHFIDFSQFSTTRYNKSVQPIWFSVIRDPIDKFVSRYHYNRGGKGVLFDKLLRKNDSTVLGLTKEGWRNKDIVDCVYDPEDPECNFVPGSKNDLSIPYFCGQDDECTTVGSRWALEKAKHNIKLWFPVIGVLEDMESSLFVMERNLPQFFKGISDLYYNRLGEPHKNKGQSRTTLPGEVHEILRKRLELEYELYNFIRLRLKYQKRYLKTWRLQKIQKRRD